MHITHEHKLTITLCVGNELLGKLRKMRTLEDDDEDEVKPSGPAKGQTSQQPAWMRTLLERCQEWLSALPAVRHCDESSLISTFS